jgi:hypothetical protein
LVTVTERPQKITFGEMRESGVRRVLIYCSDYHCSYYVTASGDRAGTLPATKVLFYWVE